MDELEAHVCHASGINIETHMLLAETLAGPIAAAGKQLIDCLLQDRKILLCGYGGEAANCLHFSTDMLNAPRVERPPLPVISLTTDSAVLSGMVQEGQGELIFSRQIEALGQKGDVLLLLTTSPHVTGLLQTIDAAHARDISIILLTTSDEHSAITYPLKQKDHLLQVPGGRETRVREMHLFILHCFCDFIENALFGQIME